MHMVTRGIRFPRDTIGKFLGSFRYVNTPASRPWLETTQARFWLEWGACLSSRSPIGRARIAVRSGALNGCGNDSPGGGAIQRRKWEKVEHNNSKAKKAQNGKNCVDGLKPRVAEHRDPSDQRQSHHHLGEDSTPGDDAVVETRPWGFKLRQPKNGIELNGKNLRPALVGGDDVSPLVDK